MESNKIIPLASSPITAVQKLWHAMQGIWYADELAFTLNSLQVNSFPEISGDWITTLEGRAAMLNQVGGEWHEIREKLAAPLLSAIISYNNSFSVLNEHLRVEKDMDSESIIAYMQSLYETAKENATVVRRLKQAFDVWENSVNNVFSLLEKSMEEGWSALDVEEASVSKLTGEIAVVQNIMEKAQDSIMPNVLSKEGKIAKSFGKVFYNAMIVGKSVSFLSVGSMFFSVGATFYEIFSGYSEVKSAVEEIQKSKMELTLRQQALAQTKSLIRFLQKLQLKVVALDNELDDIVDLWDDEKSFLQNKLFSFRVGADPKKTNLVAEAATWETLSQFAKKFMEDTYKSDSFNLEI